MNLSYMQVGWIAFALNMTSSIMQPVFGMYSDKKPSPFLLPLGMFSSMLGMIGLAFAPNFIIVIISVLFIGLGSAVFHPEGARVAYMAAGAKRGLAQAIYQVGETREFLSSYFYSANFRSTRSNWFIRFYSICSSRNCIINFRIELVQK